MKEMVHSGMRVAFVGNQLTNGGGATSLFLMLRALKDENFKKYVWLTEIRSVEMQNTLKTFCEEVVLIELDQVVSCQTYQVSNETLQEAIKRQRGVRELIKKIKEHQIDVIHFNNSVFSHVYEHIAQETGVKIITHVREWVTYKGRNKLETYIVDQIQKYSQAIVAISQVEAAMFDTGPKVKVIANPFDFSEIENHIAKPVEGLAKAENTSYVGMMGRFEPSKGYMEFLMALKYIKDHGLVRGDIKFVILGIKPHDKSLKTFVKGLLGRDLLKKMRQYIKKHHLESNVLLLPYQKDVFSVVSQVDVMVRPSWYGDAWGRDIIESMAMGKPIVAFGDSQFFVKQGKSGFLVEKGNIQALAEAISTLANDPALTNDFGLFGAETIRNMCNLQTFHKQLMQQVYQPILSE